ncbi:hypothetical protein KSP40_PGU005509 [Platanthera guangdongensis]|uniref:Uncharacterized protein n=1 Tax=Platanthera guangdongensis TaxID=2320717 RepID=A0ABR2MB34_9ASPA
MVYTQLVSCSHALFKNLFVSRLYALERWATHLEARFFEEGRTHRVVISFHDGQEHGSMMKVAIDGQVVHESETRPVLEGNTTFNLNEKTIDFSWQLDLLIERFTFRTRHLNATGPENEPEIHSSPCTARAAEFAPDFAPDLAASGDPSLCTDVIAATVLACVLHLRSNSATPSLCLLLHSSVVLIISSELLLPVSSYNNSVFISRVFQLKSREIASSTPDILCFFAIRASSVQEPAQLSSVTHRLMRECHESSLCKSPDDLLFSSVRKKSQQFLLFTVAAWPEKIVESPSFLLEGSAF